MTEANGFSDRHRGSTDGIFGIGLRGLQETVQGLKGLPSVSLLLGL